MGVQNTSASGILCQRWDSRISYQHIWSEWLPDATLGDAANYCRFVQSIVCSESGNTFPIMSDFVSLTESYCAAHGFY